MAPSKSAQAKSDPLVLELLAAMPTEANVTVTDALVRRAMFTAHLGRDFYTRAPIDFGEMSLDHVIPSSLGGRDNLFNLVPTTRGINTLKADKFDPIATVAILAVIRLHFGDRSLSLLRNLRADRLAGRTPDEEQACDALEPKPVVDPESGAWFRARLAEVGHTQASLARLMASCGDDRPEKNILRSIHRMAAGQSRVAGEMRVMLFLMAKHLAKRARQRTRRAAEAAAA